MLEFFRGHESHILIGIGCIIAIMVLWKLRRYAKVESSSQFVLLIVLFLICAFASTIAFSYIEGWISGNPNGGGLSTFGGFFIGAPMLLVLLHWFRFDQKGAFDLFSIFCTTALSLARVGCIFSGCCEGNHIFNTELRWPTRETEVVFYLILTGILLRLIKENEVPGQLAPIVMISYGTFRFINQWFRNVDDLFFGIDLAHVWAVLCIIIGYSIYTEMHISQRKKRYVGNGRK